MYRGSVRGPLAAVGVAMSVVMLAACSPSASSTTTTVPSVPSTVPQVETTTTAVDTTTTVAETTTTQPATTTTTDAGEVVGDPEALRALYEEISDEVDLLYEDYEWELEMPDINVADPRDALVAAVTFDSDTNAVPWDRWSELVTVEGSPARAAFIADADLLAVRDWVIHRTGEEGYSIADVRMVGEDELSEFIPAAVIEEMPEDGVAFQFTETFGTFEVIEVGSGEVVDEYPGSTSLDAAVMVPTELGWQMWWRDDQ